MILMSNYTTYKSQIMHAVLYNNYRRKYKKSVTFLRFMFLNESLDISIQKLYDL